MFGVGPTELAFFLVIVLLAVGPEKLPTFMRTVGKGLRQVRNASREFKEAIGLDELMREGDPFRTPPVRPPRARPLPAQETKPLPVPESTAPAVQHTPAAPKTPPPPPPESLTSAAPKASAESPSEGSSEPDSGSESKHP
jgi:Sec-independent protein translocase protein TatA